MLLFEELSNYDVLKLMQYIEFHDSNYLVNKFNKFNTIILRPNLQ